MAQVNSILVQNRQTHYQMQKCSCQGIEHQTRISNMLLGHVVVATVQLMPALSTTSETDTIGSSD